MKTRPWITIDELDSPRSIDAADAIQAASFVLFSLTGQKYPGLWSVTEQYFCETSGAPNNCYWDSGKRVFVNSVWDAFAYSVNPTAALTRLHAGKRFRLQHRPVHEITRIVINDETVDPASYSLLNNELVSNTSYWNVCSAPVVTYSYGRRPPALGRMAARRLANEFVLAAEGNEQCSLPRNVTSVARHGINIAVWDPKSFMDQGRTGLYEVDLFIAAANPSKAKKPSKIFSPDARRGYRTS